MTILEIILIALIWISYGFFSAYQLNEANEDPDNITSYFIFIVIAPLILCFRIAFGAFSIHTFRQ